MFQVGVLFNNHYRRYPDLPLRKITVSGTQYSLAPDATVSLIGSSTLPLTAEESTYAENSASQVLIAGQTLSPGSAITVFGIKYSLAPSATALVVGSSTLHFNPGSSTYTEKSASQVLIAGQTLSLGSVITVSGTPISLDSAVTALIVDSITEGLAQTTGLGSFIMSKFGSPGSNGSAGGNTTVFTGGCSRKDDIQGMMYWVTFFVILVLMR